MRIIMTGALMAGCFVIGASAQHDAHDHEKAATATAAPPTTTGEAGGMMADMKREHEETSKLVARLAESFSALEVEKDPKLQAQKLAAHGALLKELQAKIQGHSQMMDSMMKSESTTGAAGTMADKMKTKMKDKMKSKMGTPAK